jgi:histidine triad (HIT) family protein
MACAFCQIANRAVAAAVVFEAEHLMAFLDHRPLFPGHCLLIPRRHVDSLAEVPDDLVAPFFTAARRIAQAVELAMEAEGTFVALNNKVSQSVPHLHLHVVPRRRKDGLRGFFWPRQSYASAEAMREVADKIAAAIEGLAARIA